MISAVPVDFPDSALEAEVLDDLGRVEESLAATAHPDDELLTEASRHLIAAGGKRFRAMLVLLAAQFGDPKDPRVIQAAVAIELTHLATLFHDDVMDEALVRRGHPSVNSRWDNSVAILTGDFLFAQASQILADLGPEAVRIQAETFSRLVTGQMAETIGPRAGQDPLDFYMHVITEKTGSLIATSGRFGALFSGAPVAVADRIAAACEQIGVAWQLSDDVIDIASDRRSRARPRAPTCARACGRCRCSTRCAREPVRAGAVPGRRAAALAARGGGPDRRGPAGRGAHPAARPPRHEGVPRGRAELGARGQDSINALPGRARQGRLPGPVRLRGEADRLSAP